LFDQDTFMFGPTPDASYQVELHYFYYPESIVTAGTSWLGNNFESVLLYGSLLEAATFMKEEADVLQNYVSRYNEALALIKQLGDGKNRRDAYRNGQVRDAVK
jgi:predicted PolB exonuclease-like 3'-5' exonuclease